MTAPSYVGSGSNSSGGNPTAGAVSGIVAGDILMLFAATPHLSATPPGGWTAITGFPVLGPVNSGSEPWFNDGGDHAARCYGWWRRAVGGEGGATVTSTNAHVVQCAVRGCIATGDPFESVTKNGGEWNAASCPAGVTASPDCLVLTLQSDSATGRFITSWTNAALASLTERFDTNNAGAGDLHWATGTKAAAGAFGATAVVLGAGADGIHLGASLVLRSQLPASGPAASVVIV